MMPQEQEQVLAEGAGDAAPAGVVLAAGAGTRLRPLTRHRPKPLCPVGDIALIDHALDRVRTAAGPVAVNLHHGGGAIADHLRAGERNGRDADLHLSIEDPAALGTAGALGQLRPWLDGRDVLVVNADTWCPGSLAGIAATWDRQRVRLVVPGSDSFDAGTPVAAALMPWTEVARLAPVPSGLYEASWRRLADTGQLDVVRWDGPCVDCGTPARYLEANLTASGGEPVIGAGATVRGTVERSVVWGGAEVHPSEHLVDAIRTDAGWTVLVR